MHTNRQFGSGQSAAGLSWEEVDCPWAVPILFDEAAMVLCAGGRVHCGPAMLAVVSQTVYVSAKVGCVSSGAVNAVAFITDLIVQDVRLDFDLVCVCVCVSVFTCQYMCEKLSVSRLTSENLKLVIAKPQL